MSIHITHFCKDKGEHYWWFVSPHACQVFSECKLEGVDATQTPQAVFHCRRSTGAAALRVILQHQTHQLHTNNRAGGMGTQLQLAVTHPQLWGWDPSAPYRPFLAVLIFLVLRKPLRFYFRSSAAQGMRFASNFRSLSSDRAFESINHPGKLLWSSYTNF